MLTLNRLRDLYDTEQILVILISRMHFGKEDASSLQEFITTEQINWDYFLQLLRCHSIGSFVSEVIHKWKVEIPIEISRKLKHEALRVGMGNLHRMSKLTEILRDLKQAGIKVIPYKGVGFAVSYYSSLALRAGSDIDLLVSRSDVPQIRSYFRSRKYSAKMDVPDGYLSYFLNYFKDIVFTTPKDAANINCSIEVQWRLIDRSIGRFPDYSFFEKHLEHYKFDGNQLCRLVPTYELLCVGSNHLIKDHLYNFKYLIDIASLIDKREDEIDVNLIEETLRSYGYMDVFFSGLAVVDHLLGVKLKKHVKKITASAFSFETALAFPLKKKTQNFGFNGIRALLIYDKTFFGRLQRKSRLLSYLLLPNANDFYLFKLPVVFFPLLVFLKPFRLFYNLVTGNKN